MDLSMSELLIPLAIVALVLGIFVRRARRRLGEQDVSRRRLLSCRVRCIAALSLLLVVPQAAAAQQAGDEDVDHAGIIRSWNDTNRERGRKIYDTHCYGCHGYDGDARLPDARSFKDDELRAGSDPHSMWRLPICFLQPAQRGCEFSRASEPATVQPHIHFKGNFKIFGLPLIPCELDQLLQSREGIHQPAQALGSLPESTASVESDG